MTCALKSHTLTRCCGSPDKCQAMIGLASRNLGYMAPVDDPILKLLSSAGLVTTRPSGDAGYVIVRAVQETPARVYAHGSRFVRSKPRPRAVEPAQVQA